MYYSKFIRNLIGKQSKVIGRGEKEESVAQIYAYMYRINL